MPINMFISPLTLLCYYLSQLFPTLNPTLFPTMTPTYCGKASKSWWNSSSRRLGDWTSKSSKSESCHSGSRSGKSSWKRAAANRSVKSRDGSGDNIRRKDHRNHNRQGGKHKERDLGQEEPDRENHDAEFKPDGMKVRRRRINGDRRAHIHETEPSTR